MDKVTFGRMGDQVTRLGFGAFAIGSKGYGRVERADALAALEAYVGGGGNFIDTARMYLDSEQIIGDFMRTHGLRDRLFICSKTAALDEQAIRQEVETTLTALGIDRVDLYYLHAPPDDSAEMAQVLGVFEALREEGKIRGIGASIKGPNVTGETSALCRRYIATGRIDAIQLIYSVFRQANSAVFEQARSAGVALVGRTVLENGFLTGKYRPGQSFTDHRHRWSQDKVDCILEEAAALAKHPALAHFDDMAQLAIRFAYDEPMLTTIIVGARNAPQTAANLLAAEKSGLPPAWREGLLEHYGDNQSLGNL